MVVGVAAELTAAGRPHAAETENVSLGGLAVRLRTPLPVGTHVTVAIFLTQDGIEDALSEPLLATATVVWAETAGGTPRAGLELEPLDRSRADRLQGFLARAEAATKP